MTRTALSKRAVGFLTQPLVLFLVLGVGFYAAWAWRQEPETVEDAEKIIRVTSADVSRQDAAWRARYGRAPTDEELTGLVKNHAREIALYRHAVAMGLDQGDSTVRRVLGQKLQRMIQGLLELSLSPTDQDLEAFFDANPKRYRAPDRITLTQVFLDPDKRDEQTLEDAEAILTKLRASAQPTEGLDGLGDPFMLQRYYPGKSEVEIARLFGQGFARSVFDLSPEAWHGPVLSGYGVHLVYVHGFLEGERPPLDTIRERVRQDWTDARRTELEEKYLNDILSSYEVVLEDPETEGD